MRFRLHAAFNQLYIGNEGYWRQFEMYGNRLHDVRQVGDDSYVLNQWYDLRLEVDADDHVKLFKNDILTHTARVSSLPDLQVIFGAGDGWSPGMIEMETLQYTRSVPAPSSLACMTGLFAVAMVARWWRRR